VTECGATIALERRCWFHRQIGSRQRLELRLVSRLSSCLAYHKHSKAEFFCGCWREICWGLERHPLRNQNGPGRAIFCVDAESSTSVCTSSPL